jgi:hypothetical protein
MCLLTIYFVIEKPISIDGKIDWVFCYMGAVFLLYGRHDGTTSQEIVSGSNCKMLGEGICVLIDNNPIHIHDAIYCFHSTFL